MGVVGSKILGVYLLLFSSRIIRLAKRYRKFSKSCSKVSLVIQFGSLKLAVSIKMA